MSLFLSLTLATFFLAILVPLATLMTYLINHIQDGDALAREMRSILLWTTAGKASFFLGALIIVLLGAFKINVGMAASAAIIEIPALFLVIVDWWALEKIVKIVRKSDGGRS